MQPRQVMAPGAKYTDIMRTLVRTLFIWLLVLALPMQGAAAASMVFCGPNHHGGGAARVAQGSTASDHARHGHAGSGHGFHMGAAGVEGVAGAAAAFVGDHAPAGDEKSIQATVQKCSACASCCATGAILATVPLVPASDPAPTVFATVAPAVEAFATDGPDRPPRDAVA